jgi:hypothetical protein
MAWGWRVRLGGWSLAAFALAVAGAGHAETASVPRTAEGRPDFQGVWDRGWGTPFERHKSVSAAVVSGAEADALVATMLAEREAGAGLHPAEDFDDGPLLPATGGGFRTSLIVEPADGKRPLTQAALDRRKVLGERTEKAEGPEALPADARCMAVAGGTPLTIAPDQMFSRIVQTPTHLVIATENMGATRIITLSAEAGGESQPAIASPYGRSVGHWEGDTLVVETTGLRPDRLSPAGDVPAYAVVERLSFVSPDEIAYSYRIENPAVMTAPMRVEYAFVRTGERMYESACHEGNYGLANMLSGARAVERGAAVSGGGK